MVFINIGAVVLPFGPRKSSYGGFDVRSSILLSYARDCTRIGWRFIAILHTAKGKYPSSQKTKANSG
jgi:hypothetical protein